MGFEKKDFQKGSSKPGFTSSKPAQPVSTAKPAPAKVVATKPVQTTPKKVVAGVKK